MVVDDSVFLTVLLSSLSESSDVIACFPGLRENGADFIKTISASNGFSQDRVRILGSKASTFTDFARTVIDDWFISGY